jgi:hypothetical protein
MMASVGLLAVTDMGMLDICVHKIDCRYGFIIRMITESP